MQTTVLNTEENPKRGTEPDLSLKELLIRLGWVGLETQRWLEPRART